MSVPFIPASSSSAKSPNVFDDAVAVWHFADLNNAVNPNERLTAFGQVQLGVELVGTERQASLLRGGDGKAASLDGGYLEARLEGAGLQEWPGTTMTLAIRLRAHEGRWSGLILGEACDPNEASYRVYANAECLVCEITTNGNTVPLSLGIPLWMIGSTEWHDIVLRRDRGRMDLFIDGVWADDDFPLGATQHKGHPLAIGGIAVTESSQPTFHGLIDHLALWNRPLSEDEIALLSGGSEEVGRRRLEFNNRLYGSPDAGIQYWKPAANFNVGDCMPFFHDGVFHLFYLRDKRHAGSKNGLGAHQWAHASTRDLVHWEHHPLALGVDEECEASICTGSLLHAEGTFYAFYATRLMDWTEHLSMASSQDGIHFVKQKPNPFASPPAGYAPDFRDPAVFRDDHTGLFHLLVTSSVKDGRGGCLTHLQSRDLRQWEFSDPLVLGTGANAPECADYFSWNGWYYLLYSPDGMARYLMSRHPWGPWIRPAVDVFDVNQPTVMKTASFTGNRRIGAAWISQVGWGDRVMFREIIQQPDGTLGTKFVPEMIPRTAAPEALSCRPVCGDVVVAGQAVRLSAFGHAAEARAEGVPCDARITLRVEPGAQATDFRLRLRASPQKPEGIQLWFAPKMRMVQLGAAHCTLSQVEMEHPFVVDIILKGDVVDVCLDERHTLLYLAPEESGEWLSLFSQSGEVSFTNITICPLLPDGQGPGSHPD